MKFIPDLIKIYSPTLLPFSEIVSLIDPIIFKFDGAIYAIITIAWGLLIGLASAQAKNWADEI